MRTILLATLNGRLIYRRILTGYRSRAGHDLAIRHALRHAFHNYEVQVTHVLR